MSDLTGSSSGDRASAEVSELLTAAIAAADDPVAVLESAATDKDPAVADAAAPYLRGDLSLPPRERRPPDQPSAATADQDEKLRRRAREAQGTAKLLRRELRGQQKENNELQRQLTAVTERAEDAEASVTRLRRQLPSRREREALASASSQYERVTEMKRTLEHERAERRAQVRELRGLVSEAEAALAIAQEMLDAEARGRHKLEADLGDDAGRRAARLMPLVQREAADLRERAAGLPDGPVKTRQLRRAKSLDELVASLRDLYCLDAALNPGTRASVNGDGQESQRSSLHPGPVSRPCRHSGGWREPYWR